MKTAKPSIAWNAAGALSADTSARAFSRFELCVVLSVLALLLAVVWPALAGARSQADRLRCLANLGEIGKAYNLWAADHEDYYPFVLRANEGGIRTPYSGLEGNSWFQFAWVSNELRTARVLACPSDVGRRVAEDFSFGADGLLDPNHRNNSISYFLTYASTWVGNRILSGDRNIKTYDQSGCGVFGPGWFPSVGRGWDHYWDERIHQGIGNLLYADGGSETVGKVGLQRELLSQTDNGFYHLLTP